MGMFKSAQERRIERDLEVRKGLNALKRNIRELEQHEHGYLEKARRAKKLADTEQLQYLKNVLKKTLLGRKLRERQLLSLETALQIKNQAESDAEFARALLAVSRSVAEVYNSTDLVKTQKEFERALVQAETLGERMKIFLDVTTEHVSQSARDGEEMVSDQDLERMLEERVAEEESAPLDRQIDDGLREIEKELASKAGKS